MPHRVGIDLGTTNSAIAFTALGRQRCVKVEENEFAAAVFPSCVGLRDGRPIYGAKARRDPAALREFKRDMGTEATYRLGEQTYTPIQLSALILAEMRDAFVRRYGPVSGAVITVPANYDDLRRTAVKEAGKLAGLEVLRIINEPSAAAIAYSLSEQPPGENAVVIDWGGGTLDVSLVDCIGNVLDVKANDGDERCGGKDIDALVLELVLAQAARQLGKAAAEPLVRTELLLRCEQIKISLSQEETWDEPIGLSSQRLFLPVTVTRGELEKAAGPLVDRVVAAVERCLAKCPEGALRPQEVTDVILVGGSCYLPLLRRRVAELFGREGRIDLDPMEVVALGAAYQAEHADRAGRLITIHSLTKSLGTSAVGEDSLGVLRQDLYVEILPATAKLPAKATQTFGTLQDEQEEILVGVYENGDGRETVEGLVPWCERPILGLPPLPAGSFPIEVTYEYSLDQTLMVNVKLPGHGIDETWQADHVLRLEKERAAAAAGVKAFREGGAGEMSEYARVVRARVGKAGGSVGELLGQLEAAVAKGDLEGARVARRKLGVVLAVMGIRV